MSIPYRTRSFLKRLGILLLILAVIAAVILLCWFFWLDQYVIYTRNGVVLDLSRSSQELTGQPVSPPVITNPITIHYHDGSESLHAKRELTQLGGYYITQQELEADLPGVMEQIKAIPAGSAVMIDVKSIYGTFFYSSKVCDSYNKDLDIAMMDQLIRQLCAGDYYVIARLPAMCDRRYGLENVQDGLPVAAGYLWMDNNGCYWLDPKSSGTITYWAQMINELKGLGFDEVVLSHYYFPEDDSIVYQKDKPEALAQAAQTLVNTCATDSFAVSFTADATFQPPTGRFRLYMDGVAASEAQACAEAYALENPAAQLLFITENHDTRYDTYSVLRPLSTLE